MTASLKTHRADYAVVGSGVAGLRAAIELSQTGSVLVLAKSDLSDSATAWAQGGLAVALSDEDEISLHEQDTIKAGDGLCRADAVALLVEEGPKYITELIEWGTEFDCAGTKLAFTTELIVESGAVVGLRFIDELDGSLHELRAEAVLLATGGLGQIYRETTNPEVVTGDGMAIAYEAGAALSDMEFVQFHPTALAVKGAPRFLLSEALRGEGAILRNINLERFMKRYNEAQELASRDVVARAIVSEMHRTSSEHVYLDMTAKPEGFVEKRFPRIYATCMSYGVDLARDVAPVCPAAHYMMGGVKTDLWGRSSLPGLYAAGETADTGVHGANRLASNSLLEGLVFGARSGQAMMKDAPVKKKHAAGLPGSPAPKPGDPAHEQAHKNALKPAVSAEREKMGDVMWKLVGILRSGKELASAIEQLKALELPKMDKHGRAECELRNMHELALVMAKSALARLESRGSHYRSDFPYRDDEDFGKHSVAVRGKEIRFEG